MEEGARQVAGEPGTSLAHQETRALVPFRAGQQKGQVAQRKDQEGTLAGDGVEQAPSLEVPYREERVLVQTPCQVDQGAWDRRKGEQGQQLGEVALEENPEVNK